MTTIIVLLILAGITLAMVVGDNGIIAKAQNAKKVTNDSQTAEENRLNNYENKIDDVISRSLNVQLETGYEATTTTIANTISLGQYNISDYDFLLITAKAPTDNNGIITRFYSINDIEIGTSTIRVETDGLSLQYRVTDNKTLTKIYDTHNGMWYISSIRLIKLK